MAEGGVHSSALLATARTLAVDGVTVEVVRAFRASGIRPILLKGPSIALWLYDDGSARYYADSDILVPRDRLACAEAVLSRLGFERGNAPATEPSRTEPHSEPWFRERDRAEVDLHSTLFGLGVPPGEAWARVAANTVVMPIAGEPVEVLGMDARTLLVALHAAQHGAEKLKPLEDLRRALRRVPLDDWRAAAALADELHATLNMSRGLRLLPDGEVLADRLGLISAELTELAAQPDSPAELVAGIERLARTPGALGKARLVARELLPPPSFMRWSSPLARRRFGLPPAYAWRLLWLIRQLPPSVAAWRRARGRTIG